MLGKFEEGSQSSYDYIARKKAYTYFSMDDNLWNSLAPADRTAINNAFLRQQLSIPTKEIYTSHKPLNQTRSFKNELLFLRNEYSIFEYEKIYSEEIDRYIWKAFR